MSETVTEPNDVDLNHWTPGARFFAASDGKFFIVDSDTMPAPGFVTTVIRRPTAIFYCGPAATVTDLDPDHMFPPGTTPEQAIAELGYTLEAP